MSQVWWSVKEWLLSTLSHPESVMRTRKKIQADGTRKEDLIIEVLLDIRDILVKATKKSRGGGLKTPTKNSV